MRVVHTTGIYCRAECSARPHPSNTGIAVSVAAAESAGYRACLRCRADRLPIAGLSNDLHDHVVQALDLISDGFLDRHNESELAALLGFSARHLRRTFVPVVGATPSYVAASRRAHFARLLLDDTDLTVTEIAYAAGFGSLRRMNAVMRTTFGFTPTQLRAKRARGNYDSTDGGIRLRLHVYRDHRFDDYLRALATSAVPRVEAVGARRFLRAVSVCAHPGVIEVSSPRQGLIEVLAHLPALEGLIDVVSRCRRVFGLDQNEDGPPGPWTPFEADVVSVIRSRCRDPRHVLEQLVLRHGTPVPVPRRPESPTSSPARPGSHPSRPARSLAWASGLRRPSWIWRLRREQRPSDPLPHPRGRPRSGARRLLSRKCPPNDLSRGGALGRYSGGGIDTQSCDR